ncbi:Hypothetical predicted protein [Mytilus galloprovincialis]|uniref:Uncharacterized protein n=1 Tax=Mytilus galloprovincialis TaxID=29158 RepID=A0A8B6GZE2_MYTGA|nr:Hypothetical predicted protein [Mytilus galloprovincialis]
MFGYLCLFQIIEVVLSKTCYYRISYYYSYYSSLRSKYCTYGCCSSSTSSPCCSSSYSSYSSYLDGLSNYSYTLSTAGTIGAVVGSLLALSIFVTIISCICRRMRAQRGVQGQVMSPPAVTYVTTTGGPVPAAYPQTAYQPQFGSNINIMGSTEQLNVIPPNNGNTACPSNNGNTVYPPSFGNPAYPPSYDNLAHDNMKGSESSMNACT